MADCKRCEELRAEEQRAEAAYDYSAAADARVLMKRCPRCPKTRT
ncbi:hypothetical protein [Streptomyces sp. NRRL F-5630]